MNWKNILLPASGATLGTVGVSTYFYGMNFTLLVLVAAASLLGAIAIGYISTIGKHPSNKEL